MENIREVLERITVNTQSSVRLTTSAGSGAKTVYVDPLGIPGEPHDADLILVTHSHGDHFSPADIEKIKKPGTVLVCPEQMKQAGALSVVPGKDYEAAGVRFSTVRAYNNLPKIFHPKKNDWVGYVVGTEEGALVYVAGDTDATKDAAAVHCDIAVIPVGGKYTMTAEEAAELVNKIAPKAAIPTHYGTIVGKPSDGDRFAAGVKDGILVEKKLVFPAE